MNTSSKTRSSTHRSPDIALRSLRVSYKDVTKRDMPLLMSLIRRYYSLDRLKFNRDSVRHTLQRLIRHPSAATVRLIVADGEPVGYYCLSYGWSLEWRGRDVFLDEIFINASHRNKGLGTRVLHDIICRASHHGFKAVHLVVRQSNPRATRFYLANEFTRQSVVFMTRPLTSDRHNV